MNQYEITFITKEEKDDTIVKDLITSLDGKILSSSSLGEKQLAYKIKHENRGFYATFIFELSPEKILELNKKLSLKEEVLRFLIITAKAAHIELLKPEKAIKEIEAVKPEEMLEAPVEKEEITKPAKIITKKEIIKPIVKPVAKPIEKPVEKPVEKPKVTKEVTEIEKEETDEEDRLKALDKKLDELLKE